MNNKILYEYITISIISLLFGFLTEKILSIYDNENDLTTLKKNNKYKFIFAIILFSCFLHLSIEYFGINEWQCNKVCYINGTCELICKKKI